MWQINLIFVTIVLAKGVLLISNSFPKYVKLAGYVMISMQTLSNLKYPIELRKKICCGDLALGELGTHRSPFLVYTSTTVWNIPIRKIFFGS